MSRKQNESSKGWYERTIVAFSLATDRLVEMQDSPVVFNRQARATVIRRSDDARSDLLAARDEYTKWRSDENARGSRANSIGNAVDAGF